ncbi:ferrous iron transporter B, partial [bacterium]|nr:ferrous iron transporter B [bacterium]
RIGRTIEPVFAPLGFDWRISTALIPSMGAREIVVAALGTVLAVEESGDEAEFERNLSSRIASTFGIATGLSLMVWFIFSPQCISTFAIMRRETGGWKWPVIMGAYTFGLAYLGSFLTYRISSVLLGSG